MHTITEKIKETRPTYHIKKRRQRQHLPEIYNEALLKKTELAMEESDIAIKNRTFKKYIRFEFLCPSLLTDNFK